MSIVLVSNAQYISNSGAMPAHATGDLLLVCTTNDNATVTPTVPSGYINLWALGSGTGAMTVGYKYAQSNAESTGTWTNADQISVTVWRGSVNTIVWPWQLSTNTGSTTNMLWSAQGAGLFRTGSEDTALFAYGHNRSTTNNLAQTLGAMTNLFEQGDGTAFQCAGKYQLGRTTAWAGTTLAMVTSAFWRTLVISLTEQTGYGFSGGGGGGVILPRTFEGGYSA
jgi:hypothetical protein